MIDWMLGAGEKGIAKQRVKRGAVEMNKDGRRMCVDSEEGLDVHGWTLLSEE